jgi:hypothetical protein
VPAAWSCAHACAVTRMRARSARPHVHLHHVRASTCLCSHALSHTCPVTMLASQSLGHKAQSHKAPRHNLPSHKELRHKTPSDKLLRHSRPSRKEPRHKGPSHMVLRHGGTGHKVPRHDGGSHKAPCHKVLVTRCASQCNCQKHLMGAVTIMTRPLVCMPCMAQRKQCGTLRRCMHTARIQRGAGL